MDDDQFQTACKILARLRSEWNAGYRQWAMFRLGNGENEKHRAMLREKLNSSNLGSSFRVVLDSLAEGATMALARMLDESKHAKNSIKGISGLIGSEESRTFLVEKSGEWFAHLNPEALVPYRRDQNIEIVDGRLPVAIEKLHSLKKGELGKSILAVRNESLAHANDATDKPKPKYANLGECYDLLAEVISDFSLVVEGLDVDIDGMKAIYDKQAQEWWDAIEQRF